MRKYSTFHKFIDRACANPIIGQEKNAGKFKIQVAQKMVSDVDDVRIIDIFFKRI